MKNILKQTLEMKKEIQLRLQELANITLVDCEILKVNNTYFRVSEPCEEGYQFFDRLDDFKILDTYNLFDILDGFNQSTEIKELTIAQYVEEIKTKYGDTAWDLLDGFLKCAYNYETHYEMLTKMERMLEFYDARFYPLSNQELQKKISF